MRWKSLLLHPLSGKKRFFVFFLYVCLFSTSCKTTGWICLGPNKLLLEAKLRNYQLCDLNHTEYQHKSKSWTYVLSFKEFKYHRAGTSFCRMINMVGGVVQPWFAISDCFFYLVILTHSSLMPHSLIGVTPLGVRSVAIITETNFTALTFCLTYALMHCTFCLSLYTSICFKSDSPYCTQKPIILCPLDNSRWCSNTY